MGSVFKFCPRLHWIFRCSIAALCSDCAPQEAVCDWVRAVNDDDAQHFEIVEDVGRSSFSHFCDLWFACSHFGLFRSVTKMFETIALWVVLVLFAFGMWLIVGAVWGMATDSSARRSRR